MTESLSGFLFIHDYWQQLDQHLEYEDTHNILVHAFLPLR